ncbi:ParA family protein [Candidatus Enterococcus ferrettii]|uniref:Chromosome partitioning protein n=1 Tax=Candidatus Enterococcus ferrettii TaxID=2815324 RepID=A0ABV0EYP4_9ENTE|nr:AAA family ATPase [Enterococcus sp. 665A]MBO1342532.1 AAA family ATPase [Enterococcus sp. 665A]
MKKIFIGNYKGGVGKTTSTLFLGKCLKDLGKKVLLMDLDPQSSLSEICIKKEDKERSLEYLEPKQTLNYVYDLSIDNVRKGYNLDVQFDLDYLISQYEEGLDFVASSLYYRENVGLDELNMSMGKDIRYFSILAKLIRNIEDKLPEYDYLLMDCPPNSSVITQSAFLISDGYLIPTIVDSISAKGIMHYIGIISKIHAKYCTNHQDAYLFKHYFGENPKLIGIFYTLIRGQVRYDEVIEKLRNELGKLNIDQCIYVFESFTNNYVAVTRAVAENKLGNLHVSKNTYPKITKEFLKRLSDLNL